MNDEDWVTTPEYKDEELHALPTEEAREQPDRIIGDTKLPKFLEGWVKEATNVSHYNEIPAAMTALVLVGQMCKGFVRIPIKSSIIDSRVHFIWIQTSGTGKSELMNFVIPVSKGLWDKINAHHNYREHKYIGPHEKLQQFDNFEVVEYTDAALIGYQKIVIANEAFAEENVDVEVGDEVWEPVKGSLDGHGLARWDEFTNSGVFSKTQHKNSIVTYLNTLMNSLGGSSQVITKKLKEGPVVECHSERSIMATTFPPDELDKAITETGLFQRATVYIWKVPEYIKDEIDEMIVDNFGTFEDVNLPIEKYTEELFEIYKLTQARYLSTAKYDEQGNEIEGPNATKVVRRGPDFRDAMRLRMHDLRKMVKAEEGITREAARTFLTRMNIMMGRIAYLCSVVEAKDIKDPKKQFVVTARNVNQSAFIIRNCYKSLISWFAQSLRVTKSGMAKTIGAGYLEVYENLKKTQVRRINNVDGWVPKKSMMENYRTTKNVSPATGYNHWDKVEGYFEETKDNRAVFVRLKKEGERK